MELAVIIYVATEKLFTIPFVGYGCFSPNGESTDPPSIQLSRVGVFALLTESSN